MKATFNLSKEDVDRLESKIVVLQEEAEKIINEYLWNDGYSMAEQAIRKRIPVSNRKNRSKKMPKLQAKFGNSLQLVKRNLGFIVGSTEPYYYLVFPALGLGTSYKNKPEEFMQQGLDEVTPKIISDLETKLEQEIRKKI